MQFKLSSGIKLFLSLPFSPLRYYSCGKKPLWDIRQLNNSYSYTNNIAHYKEQPLDMRWHQPLFVGLLSCLDDREAISEFVVARHRNRLEKDKDKNDIISMIAIARTPVAQQMMEAFFQTGIIGNLLTFYQDDARARIGLTTNCREPEKRERLEKFIGFVDKMVPLTEDIKGLLKQILDPDNHEAKHNYPIFIDKEAKPTIFKDYQSQIPFNGYFACYDERVDAKIPSQLPAIHQAILDGDMENIDKLLTKDPYLANAKDPWGRVAHSLAAKLGPLECFERFYEARQQCILKGRSDIEQQQAYRFLIKNWKETGFNAVIHFDMRPPEQRETPQQRFQRAREDYLLQLKQPKPARDSLHQACIDGDISRVKQIIMAQPECIEESDLFGYPPLILAVANGHKELTQWLIDAGASLDTTRYTRGDNATLYFRLIDNVKTPEIMELILHHHVDAHDFNDRLISAIKENDIKMANYMLYYLHELPYDKGLSAIELVIKLSAKFGTEMLKTFLSYYDNYVPQGPYDKNIYQYMGEKVGYSPTILDPDGPYVDITDEVAIMLEEHNKRIDKKARLKETRPKLYKEQLIDNDTKIESRFRSDNMEIIAIIKPVDDLNENEINEIHNLFFQAFRMHHNDTEESRRNYIKGALSANGKQQAYINLFLHNGKIVSFMTFEFEKSYHPDVGNFILFHGKLTANDQHYASLGFTDIAFRPLLALKKLLPDEKIYTFIKAIPPGFGICVLPAYLQFFPKFELPPKFISFVGELANDSIYGKTIPAKLEVKKERCPKKLNFQLDYFNHVVGGDTDNAMAVIYELNNDTIKKYLAELSFNGIEEPSLDYFTKLWHQLEHSELMCAKPCPVKL